MRTFCAIIQKGSEESYRTYVVSDGGGKNMPDIEADSLTEAGVTFLTNGIAKTVIGIYEVDHVTGRNQLKIWYQIP